MTTTTRPVQTRRRLLWLLLVIVSVIANTILVPWQTSSMSSSYSVSRQIPTTTNNNSLTTTPLVDDHGIVPPPPRPPLPSPLQARIPTTGSRIAHTCLHPAGLLDRQEVIDHLLELALFLGRSSLSSDTPTSRTTTVVTLEFPTPRQAFHPMHNRGRQVDATLAWDDFFQFQLLEGTASNNNNTNNNGSSHNATATITTPPQQSPQLLTTERVRFDPLWYYFSSQRTPRQYCRSPRRRRPRQNRAPPHQDHQDYGLHLISTSPQDVIRHFDLLQAYTTTTTTTLETPAMATAAILENTAQRQRQPFLWEIAVNYYSFHEQLRLHLQQQQHKNDESKNNDQIGGKNDLLFLPWVGSKRPRIERILSFRLQHLVNVAWQRVLLSSLSSSSSSQPTINSAGSTTRTINGNRSSNNNSSFSSSLIGFLHIRRGDTIHECKTTVSKLHEYLNCSLRNLRLEVPPPPSSSSSLSLTHVIHLTLLVGTDEADPSYLPAVEHMIHRDLSPMRIFTNNSNSTTTTTTTTTTNMVVHMMDAEALVWDTLRHEVETGRIPSSYLNNFHAFAILQELQHQKVHFQLEQRRQGRHCKDCEEEVIVNSKETKQVRRS